MTAPVQTEFALPNADFRDEVVFVDELQAATDKLRADGFQVVGWTWVIGKGQYRLHASRINLPGPDLDKATSANQLSVGAVKM